MTDPLTLLIPGVALAVLAWDIALAGWIAARREAPRPFTHITAFCGLLVAPALLVSVATGTETGARAIGGITWLMPLVAVAFVLQVLYSLGRRLVSVVVALPILLYDVAVAVIAIGDFLVAQYGAAPLPFQAAVAARDVMMGMTIGRAALVSPLAALVPIIAPAYPARWRLSGAARALLVLAATACFTLLVLEWPRGMAAVQSYAAARREPMQARPAGDFALGLRLFPVLDGPPPARAVLADRRLAEAFAPEIVLVVLDEDGARGGALDSLARVLQPLRDDSVRVAVALRLGRRPTPTDDAARQAALERVLRRIGPDVIFPALPDPLPSVIGGPSAMPAWWRQMLRRSAETVARVRPRTRLGWSATRLDATDSAVYAWAAAAQSPVELVGAAIYPSFSGLPSVDARLRALDRWHRAARAGGGGRMPHWLVNVGGLPHAHGDDAQLSAMRHTLAWGSRRPWINAALLGDPADYDGWTGLRAANGRLRAAVPALAAAARQMRDVRPEGRADARPLTSP
jgi:hypothetical protein